MPTFVPNYSNLYSFVKGKAKLNHKSALKQIRQLDPNALKGIKNRSKFSPQAKVAIEKKVSQHIEQFRANSGENKEFLKISRRKGEAKGTYTKRINAIKKKYGQADILGNGIYVQKQRGVKHSFSRSGNIIGKGRDGFRSFNVPPSKVPPNRETIATDLAKARREFNKKGGDPNLASFTVMIGGNRSSTQFNGSEFDFLDFREKIEEASNVVALAFNKYDFTQQDGTNEIKPGDTAQSYTGILVEYFF